MINGNRIRYLFSGSASVVFNQTYARGRPSIARKGSVLFIHGLGSSSERWLDIPDALSLAGYDTFAIDLPGFGGSQSDPSIQYTVDYLAEATHEFMKVMNLLPDHTAIVGHSLGGYIAARIASKFSAAKKLILIDSSGLLEKPTPLLQDYLSVATNPEAERVREVFQQMVADPTRIPEALVRAFISRMAQHNAKEAFTTAFESSTSTQLTKSEISDMHQMRGSTFLIWGEKDRLIPLEYFTRFTELLPGAATAMVSDAGHAPFAEKPALVFRLIQSFLSSEPSVDV